MRVLVVLGSILLACCSNETRHFRGVPPVRVTVSSSVFDIRHRGSLAESVRINAQYAPRLGAIGVKAGFAMEAVSGCDLRGVLGDQAVMTGVLDCADVAEVSVQREYDCMVVVQWLNQRGHQGLPVYDRASLC